MKESQIKLALELVREIPREENGTHFMIMQIKAINLPENLLDEDGHVRIEKAQTIVGSGLDGYHETEAIGRLSYAKPNKKLSWIG